jgi:hypothetical protein
VTTAAELLARVERAYATCASYRDMGEIVSVTLHGDRPWQRSTARFPFQCAFVRPGRFRFELKQMTVGPSAEWPHLAVAQDGGRVRSWDTIGGGRSDGFTALEPALVAASELCGATFDAPQLLGATGAAGGWARADEVELAGLDEIDGRPCHRLVGRRFGRPLVLWIDAASAAIARRFERVLHTPELDRARRAHELARGDLPADVRRELERTPPLAREVRIETTTLLRPAFDVEIEAGVFDLVAPA